MPINIHVGEDKWMYEPMDQTNDGLMNTWKWRVTNAPGILQHDEVVDSLKLPTSISIRRTSRDITGPCTHSR